MKQVLMTLAIVGLIAVVAIILALDADPNAESTQAAAEAETPGVEQEVEAGEE